MALPASEVRKLSPKLQDAIRHPWSRARRKALGRLGRYRLRRFLNKHGHITPNFTWAEAKSKPNPYEPRGKRVPLTKRRRCIKHAWNLERVRHRVGDQPLSFLSWYRSPVHNKFVGGASQSRHMEADATDFTPSTIHRIGRSKLMAALDIVFWNGGVGDYPSGAVHCDSRGYRARWRSF